MTHKNCTDFPYFFSFFVFQLSEQNKKLVEAIGKRQSLDAETFKRSVLKLMSEMAPSALKTEMLSVAEIEIERNMSVQRTLPSMQSEIVDLSANQPIVEAAANTTTTSTTNEGGSNEEGKKRSKKRSPSTAVEQDEMKKAAKAKKKASEDDSQNVQNTVGDVQGDTISPEGGEGSKKPFEVLAGFLNFRYCNDWSYKSKILDSKRALKPVISAVISLTFCAMFSDVCDKSCKA